MKTSYATTIFFFVVTFFTLITDSRAQLERVETEIPAVVPIKVEVKNSDSETWVHDLEVVVTNTGRKPIYYLALVVTLDVKAENGTVMGFSLDYGDGELYSGREATSNDIPIRPKESYTFKIRENSATGWDLRREQQESYGNFTAPKNAILSFSWLSFGDGSGIKGGGVPYQKKK